MTEAKKGKPTWRPANVDDVFDREDGYRYRWLNKDPRNLKKKEAEGWEVVSDIAGAKTQSEGGYGRIDDGKPLTSVREGYDRVLGRLPEDIGKARDEYVNDKSNRLVSGLRKQARDEMGKSGAPVHGSISMEQRGKRTVIKE